ncbi:MAG: transposase [bacterium]
MARLLRITYPGAIYHIINRGCRKDKIFRRIADHEEFLERLTFAASKYGIIVHGYSLMNNYFHLLIETPDENLFETRSSIKLNKIAGYCKIDFAEKAQI